MDFRELSSFFLIPLGILIVSGLLQWQQFNMRLNAGIEFFTFLVGLDLSFLMWGDVGPLRINPEYQGNYGPLFSVLCLGSLILMVVAARVQSRIYEHIRGQLKYYPLWPVSFCWLFALGGIGFHLYVALGGSK